MATSESDDFESADEEEERVSEKHCQAHTV